MRRKQERLSPSTRQLGQSGEELAVQYLIQHGYTPVTRNWRCEAGEIDVIMRKEALWVFVEVKSVSGSTLEAAASKVNRAKQKKLVRCLYAYLDVHQLDVETRVDVIAIARSTSGASLIEHREDILDFDLFSGDEA